MKLAKYNVSYGVERRKIHVKQLIVAGVASLGMVGGLAGVSMAAGAGYGTQPGYDMASDCGAIHGAFGAFSGDHNLGMFGGAGKNSTYHDPAGAVGQEPGATGYKNSHTDCQG